MESKLNMCRIKMERNEELEMEIKDVVFKNYTPHEVVMYDDLGNVAVTYESLGSARVSTEQTIKNVYRDIISGVVMNSYKTKYGEVEGLPEQEENVMLYVSFLVKQALPNRTDLICPNTTPTPQGAVRNEDGQIIGVKSLQE